MKISSLWTNVLSLLVKKHILALKIAIFTSNTHMHTHWGIITKKLSGILFVFTGNRSDILYTFIYICQVNFGEKKKSLMTPKMFHPQTTLHSFMPLWSDPSVKMELETISRDELYFFRLGSSQKTSFIAALQSSVLQLRKYSTTYQHWLTVSVCHEPYSCKWHFAATGNITFKVLSNEYAFRRKIDFLI